MLVTVDFETEAIEKRPVYPPKPVGVAIKWEGKKPKYYAWGHPTENNCTKTEVVKILKDIFRNHVPVFHNAAFDIMVAVKHMGCKFPKEFHDTLFLAYLNDPREESLSLKPLADKYLDMPPEEQDELYEWIDQHIYKPNKWRPTRANPYGAHIAEAPGKLVGKYAIGDVVRTEALFYYMEPKVIGNGMERAYTREREVLPIFEEMSETGICVAQRKLQNGIREWEEQVLEWERLIRKRLKSTTLDINSSKQLAEALDKTGKVTEWEYTAKGNRSTAKQSLLRCCNDKTLLEWLRNYGSMQTYLSTFARPWLDSALSYNGRVYPSFNQVRTPQEHGKSYGTRTGRPSSTNPNFLNVPANQQNELLPSMRNYLIPDPGTSFLIRDYSQQELRIAAHFEEDILYQAYLDNPYTDAHELVGDLITEATGIVFPRKPVKIVNFGVIYGMGIHGTANAIEGTEEEARELLNAHAKALPGIRSLSREIQSYAKKGNAIRTWGGRLYYAEKPKLINGVKRDFYYKLLNYLIQGSGADCTKEAMIRVNDAIKGYGRVVLQVYDELVITYEKGKEEKGMQLMKEAMESIEFDIPMLTDGKIGKRSWGEAIKSKI